MNLLRSLCPIPTLTLFWYQQKQRPQLRVPPRSPLASSTCVSFPSEQDCLAKTRLHQIDPQAHGVGTCRSLDLRKKTGMRGWNGDGRRKVDGLCFKVGHESNEIPSTFMAQPWQVFIPLETSVFNVDVGGGNGQYDRGALEDLPPLS